MPAVTNPGAGRRGTNVANTPGLGAPPAPASPDAATVDVQPLVAPTFATGPTTVRRLWLLVQSEIL